MDDKLVIEVDRDTLDAFSQRAERHGLSVDQEVRAILRESLATPSPTNLDWVQRARDIRAMTPPGSIVVDSWKLIRASRDWDH